MIEQIIEQRRRSLGGHLDVGRVLPSPAQRMVGPFIFFDHLGPLSLPRGIERGTDVRPHPHIGLSTVTYLFAGEMMHRDSLGFEQAIRPHEVNWMTAGSGITHSERLEQARAQGGQLHGIQAWVALPAEQEEIEAATVMLLGGDPVGERYLYWNFVSSSRNRLAQAASDWRAGRMKLPDADDAEFIPLPEGPLSSASALLQQPLHHTD